MRCDEEKIKTLYAYGEIIRENIDYNSLMITHKLDAELVSGIYDLILEMVMSSGREILIASER